MDEALNLQKAFGEHLEKMGQKHKSMVVLDSDLSNSLNTLKFAKLFPERHHTIGLSDSAMINMAAGFAARKKIPFVCGKAITLIGRGFEAIRNNLAMNQLNIKLIGSNCGLANSENGAHECMLEDLALLQSIPDVTIFSPADAFEMRQMMEEMALNYGVYYLRLSKAPAYTLFDQNYQFKSTKAEIIKAGDEICIFTTGPAIHLALNTASELEKRGTSVQVVNISTIHPLDIDTLNSCAENFQLLVSIEEHHKFGGLGSAILTQLNNQNCKKPLILGSSTLTFSGRYQDALEKQKLDQKNLYEQIKNAWLAI